MPVLRPLRVVGPALLAVFVGAAATVVSVDSALAETQVALLGAGGLLFTVAGFQNPLRDRLGWRPLLALGEVAVGIAVPLGVLGTGVDGALGMQFGALAAVAALALVVVVGAQVVLLGE